MESGLRRCPYKADFVALEQAAAPTSGIDVQLVVGEVPAGNDHYRLSQRAQSMSGYRQLASIAKHQRSENTCPPMVVLQSVLIVTRMVAGGYKRRYSRGRLASKAENRFCWHPGPGNSPQVYVQP